MIRLEAPLDALQRAWAEIYESGQFTEGPYRKRLEGALEERTGMHAVSVSSCGAGLFAMYRAQGGSGHVAVQNNTFFATGAMAIEAGFEVALVDCDPDTFSMCPLSLEAALRHVPLVGVVLTHVGGGLSPDYAAIADICRKNGLWLFEDAAHAFGVRTPSGVQAGDYSLGAVYSLYPTKAVPAGEGGVVVTRDKRLADFVRRFTNYGKAVSESGQIEYAPGFNLRMDEWTSAVALEQVKRTPEILRWRKSSADKLSELILPPRIKWLEGASNWYKFPVKGRHSQYRESGRIYAPSDQLSASLRGAYPGKVWSTESLYQSLELAETHMCLPVEDFRSMTDDEIVRSLRKV